LLRRKEQERSSQRHDNNKDEYEYFNND